MRTRSDAADRALVRHDAEHVRDAFVRFGFRGCRATRVTISPRFDDTHEGGRHLAATRGDGSAMTLSPTLAKLDRMTRLAIIAHEWGHVVDLGIAPGRWLDDGISVPDLRRWRARTRDEIERAADQIAEAVLGAPISYAGPKNLQTFAAGAVRPCDGHAFCAALRPRPVGLRLGYPLPIMKPAELEKALLKYADGPWDPYAFYSTAVQADVLRDRGLIAPYLHRRFFGDRFPRTLWALTPAGRRELAKEENPLPGSADTAPIFVFGALAAVAALVYLGTRSVAKKVATVFSTRAPGMPPRPPPPPPLPGGTSSSFLYPPLYLYIYQNGASAWQGIGWYFGELRQADLGRGQGVRLYHFSAPGQVIEVLESLAAQGIGGWFDTIEPVGIEDANWAGRFGPGLDVEVYIPAHADPQFPGSVIEARYEARTTQEQYSSIV